MERGFIYLDEAVHGIRWDAKYATWDNFTGNPVDGYESNRIVVTIELADALRKANENAAALGYGLLVWDAYRPQRAVDCFLKWAGQPDNGSTKEQHYPNMTRKELISRGYIAEHSGHSRGGAIDLTLYSLDTQSLVPMGSSFDFMDEISHHNAPGITCAETGFRNLLRSIMEQSGFDAYENEWWHYMLKNEPYPDRYFDFPII